MKTAPSALGLSKLPRPPDSGQEVVGESPSSEPAPGPHAHPAPCLDSSGKTVTAGDAGGNQATANPDRWREDLEWAYHRRLSRRERLRYRYSALGRRDERVDSCVSRRAFVTCGCGTRQVGGCGVRALCDHCRKTYRARLRRRAVKALEAHVAAAPRRWVEMPAGDGKTRSVKRKDRLRLLTLTVRHSGDVEVDRERLQRGWVRLRAWIRKSWGYSPAYVGCWEVTPGRDNRGHIHLHVITLWPYWVDYGELCAAWRRAVDDDQAAPDVKLIRKGAAGGVWYVMHYSSKGLDVAKMSGELAGDVLATLYARRAVTTSRGFWLPRPICCEKCGQWWDVERPQPVSGGEKLRAAAWAIRGPPPSQLGLVERSGAALRALDES